jgi:hypothetical protein
VKGLNQLFGFGMLAVMACGGENNTPSAADRAAVKQEPAKEAPATKAAPVVDEVVVERGPTPAPTGDYDGPVQEIVLESDGDMMKWKLDRIEVVAGQRVKITIKNNATTPSMQHNLLIVTQGSVTAVGLAAARMCCLPQRLPKRAPPPC